MRALSVFVTCVAVLTTGLLCRVSAQGPDSGKIELGIGDPYEDQTATVSLYHNGKLLATKEVAVNRGRREWVKFSSLPFGTYEVRTEAPRRVTVVKKVVLRKEDKTQELTVTLEKGKGSVVFGGGPSLEELEERIKKLEAEVAKLRHK